MKPAPTEYLAIDSIVISNGYMYDSRQLEQEYQTASFEYIEWNTTNKTYRSTMLQLS